MIPVERAHLYVAATTHPGKKGKNNEDRYAVSAYRLGRKDPTPSVLAIVADGVGGHRAGEVAAEMAVEIISRTVSESDASNPVKILEEAIIRASQAINHRAGSDPARQGMSTTCACVWVLDDRLYIASVGDSRIYLVRGDTIQQLTTDHTWVQEAIENGTLAPEEARNHPNAHVIRRHLGSFQPVIPDLRLKLSPDEDDATALTNQGMCLLPGDTLILCTDGLTDLVDENDILQTLSGRDVEEALETLVEMANIRGGHDNITAITLQMPGWRKKSNGFFSRKIGLLPLPWLLWVTASVLLLGSITMGGYFWFLSRATPTMTPNPTFVLGITAEPLLLPTIPPTLQPLEATPTDLIAIRPTPTTTITPPPGSTPVTTQATFTPWPTSTLPPPLTPTTFSP